MQPAWVEDRHEDLQNDQYSKNGTLLAKLGSVCPPLGFPERGKVRKQLFRRPQVLVDG